MLKARLIPFFEMDGDIGGSPSVEGAVEAASTGSAPVQETPTTEGSAESESSFAKRLREHSDKAIRAEREKWEREVSEKYKDYDTHKELSTYFQEVNGVDAMTLKERIEMEKLQARAERENVPPEVLRRLDELEAKSAKVDMYEQQQQQQVWEKTYFGGLNEFVKDRGIEADKLNQFMIDNGLTVNPQDMNKSFEIALKAMKHDDLLKQVEEAEKNGMKKLLQAKGSIPTVNGKAGQGQVISQSPKTFAEARARAMQRMSNSE